MYFLKRAAQIVPLMFLISLLAFVLLHLAPGGPFDKEREPATQEAKRARNAKYHLDDPIWKQYQYYLTDVLHGDMGVSLRYRNHTVNDIIAEGLPISLTLGAMAFAMAMGIGIPLGFWSAVRRGDWGDYFGSLLAVLAVCIPGLVIGPMLIMMLGLKWRLLPVALWGSPAHVILPT